VRCLPEDRLTVVARAMAAGMTQPRMMPTPKRFPLDPRDLAEDPPRLSVLRAAMAAFRSYVRVEPIEQVIARDYGDDRAVPLITRAATAAADLETTGWAQELMQTTATDFLTSPTLGAVSAASQLLARAGMKLQFDRTAYISLPAVVASGSYIGFVASGSPIPVVMLVAEDELLTVKKFAVVVALNKELDTHSNARAVFEQVLTEAVGLQLDACMFDSGVGTTVRPAGLRYGVGALGESDATDPQEAMIADVATPVGAVSVVSLNAPVAIIGSPTRITDMRLRLRGGGVRRAGAAEQRGGGRW
jgi:hypothetical protein